MTHDQRRCFVPPHVAERLAEAIGHPAEQEARFRAERRELIERGAAGGVPDVVKIYDSHNRESTDGTYLPEPYSDQRAIEAESGLQATLALLRDLDENFGETGVTAYTHYGNRYDNAFWDGSEMVFGDGDGRVFGPFTKPVDVCAHEYNHGVTQFLCDLTYQGQSGALNESLSDCAGAVTRQRALGIGVNDDGAWLIGAKAELFLPAFTGRALRDMLNPGTAYRGDPMLGDDPQPAYMSDYVKTSQDDGGVHINSGIPNRAFALAARAIGNGTVALAIWRKALVAANDHDCTFEKFATATVEMAGEHATIVQGAWVTVGVLKANSPLPAPVPSPAPGGGSSSSDEPFPGADPAVAARIARAAGGSDPFKLSTWLNNHFRHYFRHL